MRGFALAKTLSQVLCQQRGITVLATCIHVVFSKEKTEVARRNWLAPTKWFEWNDEKRIIFVVAMIIRLQKGSIWICGYPWKFIWFLLLSILLKIEMLFFDGLLPFTITQEWM